MDKRLYKIWWFNGIHGFAMCDMMDSFHGYFRNDVVSMDLVKLQKTCEYLNNCADEDESYEVREEDPLLDAIAGIGK